MFSGLVETTGRLQQRTPRGPGYRLVIEAPLKELALGESIAVNGACLTVAAVRPNGFDADVSRETAEKTTLSGISAGGLVNLERSLRLGDRIGGHLVSGHVDAVARVERVEPIGDAVRVTIGAPPAFAPYFAPKGSVALDGVSLTINAVRGSELEVMLIPHTRLATTFGHVRPGMLLNLEVDMLARYVVRYLELRASGSESAPPNPTAEPPDLERALETAGYLEPKS